VGQVLSSIIQSFRSNRFLLVSLVLLGLLIVKPSAELNKMATRSHNLNCIGFNKKCVSLLISLYHNIVD